jgi:hypothetical protein
MTNRAQTGGSHPMSTLKAIELTGTIDAQHHLHLDSDLPLPGPQKVRVIVLYDPAEDTAQGEWLRNIAHNPAFAYLNEPEEEIYSLADGKPFRDETHASSPERHQHDRCQRPTRYRDL